MMLSDRTIKKMIIEGSIVIDPLLDERQIQPASVDLRLYKSIKICKSNGRFKKTDDLIVPANTFCLASTIETIKLPSNVSAVVHGRSSIGRKGLFVENAAFIDPGFYGQITLEFYNSSSYDIALDENMRICQIVFHMLDSEPESPYKGKYNGQRGPTESRLEKDNF